MANNPVLYGPDNKPLRLSGTRAKSSEKARRDKKPKEHKDKRPHKTLLATVLGIATLVGGIAVVAPRPTVIPSDPVDPKNSMSASFTITNSDFIPLKHVGVSIGIGEVFPEDTPAAQKEFGKWVADFSSRVSVKTWANHSLNMDDKFTVSPSDLFLDRAAYADIAIVVTYQPWLIPWQREKLFHFKTHKQTDGKLYWYSVPPT